MPTELIAGPAMALAPDLAAQLVRAGSDVVMVTQPGGPGPHLVRHRVERARTGPAGRLTCLTADPDTNRLPVSGDRLWWLDDPGGGAAVRRARQATRLLERLDASAGSRLRHITHVLPHPGGAGAADALLRALARRHAVPLRRIRVPAVLSGAPDPGGTGPDAVLALFTGIASRCAGPAGPVRGRCRPSTGPATSRWPALRRWPPGWSLRRDRRRGTPVPGRGRSRDRRAHRGVRDLS